MVRFRFQYGETDRVSQSASIAHGTSTQTRIRREMPADLLAAARWSWFPHLPHGRYADGYPLLFIFASMSHAVMRSRGYRLMGRPGFPPPGA